MLLRLRLISGLQALAFILIFSRIALGSDQDFRQALQLFRAKDYAKSSAMLLALVKKDRNRALYWFNLGNAYYALQDYQRAMTAYRWVIYLKSPLAPAAQFYIVECLYKLGKIDEAKQALAKLRAEPLPPHLAHAATELAYELQHPENEKLEPVMKLYQAHQYAEAETALESITESSPSSEAFFLKGMTLLRLRQPERALEAFKQAQAGALDAGIRSESRNFIRQIREGAWEGANRLMVSVDVWAGYNSNEFAAPDWADATGALYTHSAAYLKYKLWDRPDSTLLLEYRPSWDEIIAHPQDRVITNVVRVPWSFGPEQWIFTAAPSLEHDFLGLTSYLLRAGAQFRAERSFGLHSVSGTLEAQKNISLSQTYSYLDGSSFELRGNWTYYLTQAEVYSFASIGHESLGSLPIDGGGTIPLANWALGIGAGGTFYAGATESSLIASYFNKSYGDKAEPGDLDRNDGWFGLTGKVALLLDKSWKPFTSLSFVSNHSSLGVDAPADLNYHQWILNAGFSWSPLP